jgi:hypothetical protein
MEKKSCTKEGPTKRGQSRRFIKRGHTEDGAGGLVVFAVASTQVNLSTCIEKYIMDNFNVSVLLAEIFR